MKTTILTIMMVAVLLVAGCTTSAPVDDGRLQVVTTIGQVTDIVEHVGKDKVSVQGLMGPGIDPHLYSASEGDVRKLSNADVIFYNGLHLEAQMGDVLEKMSATKTVLPVTVTFREERLLASEDYADQFDPHVWFDINLWKGAVRQVGKTLSEADPENRDFYLENAENYIFELDDLDNYVRNQLNAIPEGQRVLITAHDAFQYFGNAYGFEVRGLQGISTEAQAGAKDVADLADFIADRQIKAIFIESSISERNVIAVQEAVRDRGFEVAVGGELFSDAMGAPGTAEGTYIGMIKHNIDTIVEALG